MCMGADLINMLVSNGSLITIICRQAGQSENSIDPLYTIRKKQCFLSAQTSSADGS